MEYRVYIHLEVVGLNPRECTYTKYFLHIILFLVIYTAVVQYIVEIQNVIMAFQNSTHWQDLICDSLVYNLSTLPLLHHCTLFY